MATLGVNVLSTFIKSGYAVDRATSMVAPNVGGVVALYKSQFPDTIPAVILNVTASGSAKHSM
jgi:hypothetical protein